jgi:hypothetical protein
MRFGRRAVLVSLVVCLSACSKGGSSDGSPPPPAPAPVPPPPPTGTVITGPSSPLPPALHNVALNPITFTGTGTGTLQWNVTAGSLPPGTVLSPGGVYFGTPTEPGLFTFTVTLTDDNGTDSDVYTQVVLGSVSEIEPNEVSGDATPLPSGVPGTGALGADDIDFWSFSATAGQVIQIESFATRRDFDSWQTNGAIPRISLFGPDGTSFLVGIDFFAGTTTFWYGGAFDLDIPRFRIPTTGTYFIRLDHYNPGVPGGEYALKMSVLALGVLQVESEGNNDTSTADAITPGILRAMRVDGDDDYYSFTITAPTIVTFEIHAYRNGLFGIGGVPDDDYFDPQIQLFDTDEATVLSSNDDVFFYDSALQFVLVNSGTYFLQVTESINFQSDGDAEYYLTYTSTPVGSDVESETNDDVASATPMAYGDVMSGEIVQPDTDFYSFSGTAGDMVRVFFFDFGAHQGANDFIDVAFMLDDTTFIQRAIDYTGVGSMACARAILPSSGTFYIRITSEGSTPYTFQLVQFMDSGFESEGNNTPATADAFGGLERVSGVIGDGADIDHFSFTAVEGEIVNFSIHAAMGGWAFTTGYGYVHHDDYGSFLLPDLEVVNSGGTVLDSTPFAGANFTGESMTNGLASTAITFRAPSGGTFFVRVISSDGSGGPEYLYLLEMR